MNTQKVTCIGQKVRVVANTTEHQFKIGEVVECEDVQEGKETSRFRGSNDFWWMEPCEYEILPEEQPIPAGRKPFDLQKALAGEPVVTRDGRPVKIAGYNPDAGKTCQICGWVNGDAKYWCADGLWMPRQTHYLDLFMATKTVKKEGWINIYACRVTGWWSTKEAADRVASDRRIACIRIEWEEEV